MKYSTKMEAARRWVEGFNAIPVGVIEKLFRLDEDDVREITPPCVGDRVYIFSGEYSDRYGENYGEIITAPSATLSDFYSVLLDNGVEVKVSKDDFEVEHESMLPMWSTMWSFGDTTDDHWLLGKYCKNHLQEMADCGFRIYEQEDFGVIFGIDGAGYDFFIAHFVPLYEARGLHWHEEE